MAQYTPRTVLEYVKYGSAHRFTKGLFILVFLTVLLHVYYGVGNASSSIESKFFNAFSYFNQTGSNRTHAQNRSDNSIAKKQDTPFCLERNICLKFSDKSLYGYSRDDSFYKELESPINYNVSINHTDEIVPRIVHFIWFSTKERTFRFHEMLAIMAASRFAKPRKILFWHNRLPSGRWWNETRRRVSNLYFVYRESPKEIRGRRVAVPEHMADVARLEALLEFGGIYLDLDSFLLYPVHDLLKYDVTMGRELPTGLANGILFSKPWCDFFKIWHHEYATFNDAQWATHSVVLPFKLYHQYPNLVHVEENSLIRPHWQELPLLYGEGKLWDWRKNNYAIHLYVRMGKMLEPDPENIKTMNTTVGEVMRYIYYGNPKLWEIVTNKRIIEKESTVKHNTLSNKTIVNDKEKTKETTLNNKGKTKETTLNNKGKSKETTLNNKGKSKETTLNNKGKSKETTLNNKGKSKETTLNNKGKTKMEENHSLSHQRGY